MYWIIAKIQRLEALNIMGNAKIDIDIIKEEMTFESHNIQKPLAKIGESIFLSQKLHAGTHYGASCTNEPCIFDFLSRTTFSETPLIKI